MGKNIESILESFVRLLLLEKVDVSADNDLYHRSFQDLPVGTVLSGERSKMNERSHFSENALEMIRQKYYPDKPSRLNCAYATFVPSSRFNAYGKLYRVKPRGKMHVANSRLVDEIWKHEVDVSGRYYDSSYYDDMSAKEKIKLMTDDYLREYNYLLKSYWKDVFATKENLKDLEVIADEMIVVEAIHEDRKLVPGTLVKLPIDITASIDVYGDDSFDRRKSNVFDLPGTIVSKLESKNVKILKNEKDGSRTSIKVLVPKNTEIEVLQYKTFTQDDQYSTFNPAWSRRLQSFSFKIPGIETRRGFDVSGKDLDTLYDIARKIGEK